MSRQKTIVIASYTSWYHTLGISSYLAACHVNPDFSILVANDFFDRKRCLGDTPLRYRLGDYALVNSYGEIDRELSRLPENVDVHVLSTSAFPYNLTSALRKRHIPYKLVVIEEGIGSYSSAYGLLQAKLRESQLSVFKKMLFCFFVVFKSIFKFLVFLRKEKFYWYNFEKGSLVINADVVESYRSELKLWADFEKNKNQSVFDGFENCVLFVSSPICELNLVSKDDFVNSVKEFLPKDKKLYIKPHPIEDVAKYSDLAFETFDNDLPFEVLMCRVDASTLVYSFSSTCCYTSFLFLGKKIHRIKGVDVFYDKLSLQQKKIIDFTSF